MKNAFIVILTAVLLNSSVRAKHKEFHCFPGICKFMHCEIPRDCEYQHSFLKKKGGLCGCCDECIMVKFKGEACLAEINSIYPPKIICAPGLYCDEFKMACVELKL